MISFFRNCGQAFLGADRVRAISMVIVQNVPIIPLCLLAAVAAGYEKLANRFPIRREVMFDGNAMNSPLFKREGSENVIFVSLGIDTEVVDLARRLEGSKQVVK